MKLQSLGKEALIDYANGLVMLLDDDKLACKNQTLPYSTSNYTGSGGAIAWSQDNLNNVYY